MRENKFIILILVILMLSATVLCSCSNQVEEPDVGKYTAEDGFAWVILEENDQFFFSRSIWSSYLPLGTYWTEGTTLILHVNDEEEYTFSMEKNKLVFLENTIGDAIVEPGTEFYYDPDWQ